MPVLVSLVWYSCSTINRHTLQFLTTHFLIFYMYPLWGADTRYWDP